MFISYANTDRQRVGPLARELADHGWSVWWDRQIPPGKTFDEVIEEALDGAKAVIAVWTESGVKSRWVRTEAAEGAARGILVPVTMGNVRPPLAFRRIQFADLSDWEPQHDHAGFTQLITALDELIGTIPIGESARSQAREDPVEVAVRAAEHRADKEDWEGVINLLETLEVHNPEFGNEYREAAELLVLARRKRDAAQVYEEAEVLYADGRWSEVVDRIDRVLEIDPNMGYGSNLKAKAERHIDEERNDRLASAYDVASEALESRKWAVAVAGFEGLLEEAPGYRDAAARLAHCRARVTAEQDSKALDSSLGESGRPSITTTQEFPLAMSERMLVPPPQATADADDKDEGIVPVAVESGSTESPIMTSAVVSAAREEDVAPSPNETTPNGRTPPSGDTHVTGHRPSILLVVAGGALLVLALILAGVVTRNRLFGNAATPITVVALTEAGEATGDLNGDSASSVTANAQSLTTVDARIGYISRLPGNYEVYAMDADGSNPIRITNDPRIDDEPTASPDGTQIAFTREIESDQGEQSDIYKIDTNGSNEINLTNFPGRDAEAAWSPDGRTIAFGSDREGTIPPESDCGCPNLDIWLMDADGSNPINLTESDAHNNEATWSPSGDTIAFTSDRHDIGGDNDIYLMDLDGVVFKRFAIEGDQGDAAWSPDGNKIAFTWDRNDNLDVYVVDLEEEGLTRLTDSDGKDHDAAWSPDGTQITFTSDRDGENNIYLMNADGSDQIKLTFSEAWEADSIWVPTP